MRSRNNREEDAEMDKKQSERSRLTTLCYIERENQYLMLHRISKKNDVNKDKWIGVGQACRECA